MRDMTVGQPRQHLWHHALPLLLGNWMQGFYRGMGKMYTTVIGTFLQATTRAVCAAIHAPKFGIVGIAFSCAIGWSLMLLFEVPYYMITCKKHRLCGKSEVSL